MERQAHYALVGLVTLIVALGLLAFTFWFIRFDFNNSFATYDVEFDTPVDGLTKGAEVHFNGIKVGEVTSLRLGNANTHQVIAEVQIDGKTPVRVDSIASLEPQGITGLFYMQISPGTARAPLLVRQPDGPPPVIHSQESALAKLLSGSGSVIENTYESLNRVNRLLSDHNIKSFSDSLDNLRDITADIKSRQQLLDDAHEAIIGAGQAADAVTKLANTSNTVIGTQLPQTAQSINAAATKLGNAADSVSRLAEAIEKPANQINSTTLPELTQSLRNLDEASASLKLLVDQAQQSPQGLLNKPVARERKVSK